MRNIHVVNGPNLNMLGTREKNIYGDKSLTQLEQEITDQAKGYNMSLSAFQSNSEGAIIDYLHSIKNTCDAIIVNLGAYTHTSIAIRDALKVLDVPVYEVHISNVYAREAFRHKSYISDIAVAVISGLGLGGYNAALQHIHNNK